MRCSTTSDIQERSDDGSNDPTYQPPVKVRRETITKSAINLLFSPLKAVSDRDKISYGKRKLDQVFNTSSETITSVLYVSVEELVPSSSFSKEACSQKASDLDKLIKSIKEKLIASDRKEQLKLLTLAPPSWNIQKTSQ